MLEKGNRVGRHLFYDIKNRGYTGSRSNLECLLKVWREVENIQPDEPPADMDVSEPVRDPDTGHMISVVAAALSVFMLADGDEDRFAEEGFEKWRSGDLSRYAKDRSETAREDLNTHSPIHCLEHCDPTNEFYRSFGDDY